VTHCVYDNPATFNREVWYGGKMLSSVSSAVIDAAAFAERYPGEPFFSPGTVHSGSLEALAEVNPECTSFDKNEQNAGSS